MMNNEMLWSVMGRFSDALGLVGSGFAFFAWLYSWRVKRTILREKERLDQEIVLVLRGDRKRFRIPVTLRRGDVTRAEVQGVLGGLPLKKEGNGGARYRLAYLGKAEFSRALRDIQLGEDKQELIIECSEKETEQFDVPYDAVDG